MKDLLEALKTLDSYGLLKGTKRNNRQRKEEVQEAFRSRIAKEDKKDNRCISQKKVERIIVMHNSGISQAETARRLNISKSTVARYLS